MLAKLSCGFKLMDCLQGVFCGVVVGVMKRLGSINDELDVF